MLLSHLIPSCCGTQVWVSDDGGEHYKTTTVMPFNNTGNPNCAHQPAGCPDGFQWGPDECQMVELAGGKRQQ